MTDSLDTWIRKMVPAANVQHDLHRKARQLEQEGLDYHFLVGAPLTNSGVDYLVHRFGAEYFTFALTRAQAERAGFRGPSVRFVSDGPARSSKPRFIDRDGVRFDSPCPDLRRPVIGDITFHSDVPFPPGACLCLEMRLQATGSESITELAMFCRPQLRLYDQGIPFRFDPVKDGEYAPQTVAAFLTICLPPDPVRPGSTIHPLSNATAQLVTVGETAE